MKIIRPTAITDSAGSFTRSTTATYFDKDGILQTAAIDMPRVTFEYDVASSRWKCMGVLIEPAATNRVLNSATAVTQNVTTTAQTYTLSFYGTGQVVRSGTSTGTTIGTHANVRTVVTFTATAGTLTLTVTGSVTKWQLETGSVATSYYPTAGAIATREADVITGTGFIYSNIAETDYAAWNPGTAYVTTPTPDRVVRTTATTHSVYERVVPGTTATAPELDPINWIRVGPTNRWAAFDDSPSTLSRNTEYLTYILKPGAINSIALLELEGTEVAVNLYAAGAQQYFGYTDLMNTESIGNWYQYFYEPFYYQTNLAVSDLVNASLLDLPHYGDTILCITVRKAGSTAQVGVVATGLVYELGKTQNGMSVGIIDYSKKDTDAYGNTILIRRKFSRRIRATFFLYSSKVDVVANLLTQYRATPVVWIGADANYSSLVVYGFYRDWDIGIPNNIGSSCSIEIEGLA